MKWEVGEIAEIQYEGFSHRMPVRIIHVGERIVTVPHTELDESIRALLQLMGMKDGQSIHCYYDPITGIECDAALGRKSRLLKRKS